MDITIHLGSTFPGLFLLFFGLALLPLVVEMNARHPRWSVGVLVLCVCLMGVGIGPLNGLGIN